MGVPYASGDVSGRYTSVDAVAYTAVHPAVYASVHASVHACGDVAVETAVRGLGDLGGGEEVVHVSR